MTDSQINTTVEQLFEETERLAGRATRLVSKANLLAEEVKWYKRDVERCKTETVALIKLLNCEDRGVSIPPEKISAGSEIAGLPLSARPRNCLRRAGVFTAVDFMLKCLDDVHAGNSGTYWMSGVQNLGLITAREIVGVMSEELAALGYPYILRIGESWINERGVGAQRCS